MGLCTSGGRPALKLHRVEFPPIAHCLFPSGNPGNVDFGFCGAPVAEVGQPYCSSCHRIAYRPFEKRRLADAAF